MADLITAAVARQHVPDAATDSTTEQRLALFITAASAAIEKYTGRVFASASYAELLTVTPEGWAATSQYPVSAVSVYGQGSDGVRVRGPALATAAITGTTMELSTGSALSLATYSTLTSLSAAVDAVSGWDAEVVGDGTVSSSRLARASAVDAGGVWAEFVAYSRLLRLRSVDYDIGELQVYGAGEQVRVEYSAGAATVPTDVQFACGRLVRWMFDRSNVAAGADGAVTSVSLGDLSYSFAAPESVAAWPADVRAALAPWVSRRVA